MRNTIIKVGGLFLLVLLVVGGYLLWDNYQKRKLQTLAYKTYEINKLIQAGNYSKAKELLKTSEAGPFKPLFLSYQLYIGERTGEKIDEVQLLEGIIESLKDDDLKALYREKYAYYLFKQGKTQEALREIEKIQEKNFNYVSSLILKAQILQKEGKHKEAKEALKKAKERGEGTYFANMAQAFELLGE